MVPVAQECPGKPSMTLRNTVLKRPFEGGNADGPVWALKRPCSGITHDDTDPAVRGSRASSTSDASSTMMDLDGNGECGDDVGSGGNGDGDGNGDDALLSVITGKRPLRQIDQLVDELIRKTNKTLDWGHVNNSNNSSSKRPRDREVMPSCGDDGLLPEIIRGAPHPSTDRRLLKIEVTAAAAAANQQLLPLIVVGRKDGDLDSPEVADMTDGTAGGSNTGTGTGTRYSGNVSHSDWPIEEVKE